MLKIQCTKINLNDFKILISLEVKNMPKYIIPATRQNCWIAERLKLSASMQYNSKGKQRLDKLNPYRISHTFVTTNNTVACNTEVSSYRSNVL